MYDFRIPDNLVYVSRERRALQGPARRSQEPGLPEPQGEIIREKRLCNSPRIVMAVMLLATSLLTGCVSLDVQPTYSNAADAGLYDWVDQELAPYLVDQLSRQPRFKGEPVLLVSMNGADVRPDIDELTRDVRARLTDRLLHTSGTGLFWRPSTQLWEHHRSKDRLRCSTASAARYFVGIDVTPASGGEYRVSLRALDVGEGAWLTGFGKTWQGRLTRNQQQALAELRTDEYLRGLRVLPFAAGETDLLAAYLATNLSCVLREQGAADYRVFVDTRVADEPKLQQLLKLVAHNLARHQAVPVTESASDAELILGGSLNKIDRSLHQIWVKARKKSSNVHLTGVDTDAYIHLDQPAPGNNMVASIAPTSLRPQTIKERLTLVSKLRMLKASDADGCRGGSYKIAATRDAVLRGECFLIEFDLYQPAHVLVLNHAVGGKLTRLPQNGCPSRAGNRRQLVPRRNVRIARQGRVAFGWAGRPGIESLYAIAVTDAEVARQLTMLAEDLPDACVVNAGDDARAEYYREQLSKLDRLIERFGESVDWQAIRVRHAQP